MADFIPSSELIKGITDEFIGDGLVAAEAREEFQGFINKILRNDKTGKLAQILQTDNTLRAQIAEFAVDPAKRAELFVALRGKEAEALTTDLMDEIVEGPTKEPKKPRLSFDERMGAIERTRTAQKEKTARQKAGLRRRYSPISGRMQRPASGFDPLDLMDFPQVRGGEQFTDDVLALIDDMNTGYTGPIGPQPADSRNILDRTLGRPEPPGTLDRKSVV